MLALKYETISPYLRDKSRLFFLSGTEFGQPLNDEWMMGHLNNFVNNLSNPEVYQRHQWITTRDYPDLTRDRVVGGGAPSDILLKDTFRQNHGIEERYRKGLTPADDIRRIMEPTTKWHWASSRGYERHLIGNINRLDSEHLNRRVIKPDIK